MQYRINPRRIKCIITFSIIFLVYSGFVLFYFFDPNGINQDKISPYPSQTAYYENNIPYCLEDDHLSGKIDVSIRYEENLTFINNIQGGMTGYTLYLYNRFDTQSNSNYLRIIHYLSITSLIEVSKFVKKNDSWVEESIEFQWRNPEDFQIFYTMNSYPATNYIYDDLDIEGDLVEIDHKWLDLGNYIIGPFKSISGHTFVSIPIVNTNAKKAYFGVEEISNNTRIIQKVKKFIIRDSINWEFFQCRLLGWKTITSKTYYLGNYFLEAINGVDRIIGINYIPYYL